MGYVAMPDMNQISSFKEIEINVKATSFWQWICTEAAQYLEFLLYEEPKATQTPLKRKVQRS